MKRNGDPAVNASPSWVSVQFKDAFNCSLMLLWTSNNKHKLQANMGMVPLKKMMKRKERRNTKGKYGTERLVGSEWFRPSTVGVLSGVYRCKNISGKTGWQMINSLFHSRCLNK